MAKMVLVSTALTLNSVDESANISRAELAIDVEAKDSTVFASDGWKESLGGLKSGTLAITVKNDLAASAIDSRLWALLGSVVTFSLKASDAAVGTSNPTYSGSVLITGHTPIAGSPGDVNEYSITYPVSGAITRATS